MSDTFRAGAARLSLEPPLGLPMVGFVRQPWRGRAYGLPLDVTALVLEQGGRRVVLCGLDVTLLRQRAFDRLVGDVAEAVGAGPEGVVLNVNHTHLAPIADPDAMHLVSGDYPDEVRRLAEAWSAVVHAKVVAACRLAAEALEPARVAWAVAEVDECVNRRERAADGRTVLGWSPDGLIDRQLTALQARRPDGSAIATAVAWGCHPVTTGYDMDRYSADFPGAMRAVVRANGGGEAIYLQGAAGNVLPRVAFTDDEREAERVGRRLGLAALTALAGRGTGPRTAWRKDEASMVPIIASRVEEDTSQAPALDAACERVAFELEPLPAPDEIAALRGEFDRHLAEAHASGDLGRIKPATLAARWARATEALVQSGAPAPRPEAPIHAVRVGDGVLVTGPGETFTEIGLAVKERSPGRPTAYLGYTNGVVGYLPIASEYPYGGYEPGTSHRGYELPSALAPACDELLVRTGVHLAERLFPGVAPYDEAGGWTASGGVPALPDDAPPHPGGRGMPGEPRWSATG
jgi:hypothetical protein